MHCETGDGGLGGRGSSSAGGGVVGGDYAGQGGGPAAELQHTSSAIVLPVEGSATGVTSAEKT